MGAHGRLDVEMGNFWGDIAGRGDPSTPAITISWQNSGVVSNQDRERLLLAELQAFADTKSGGAGFWRQNPPGLSTLTAVEALRRAIEASVGDSPDAAADVVEAGLKKAISNIRSPHREAAARHLGFDESATDDNGRTSRECKAKTPRENLAAQALNYSLRTYTETKTPRDHRSRSFAGQTLWKVVDSLLALPEDALSTEDAVDKASEAGPDPSNGRTETDQAFDPVRPRAVILCALEVEYAELRAGLHDLRPDAYRGALYEIGVFTGSSSEWEVLLYEAGKGNNRAAVATTQALAYFEPAVALFVGVAGAVRGVDLGDVILASKVHNYQSGKAAKDFRARPDSPRTTRALIEAAKFLRRTGDWRENYLRDVPSGAKAHIEAIASGDHLVVDDDSETARIVSDIYEDTHAVETEGAGFIEAACDVPGLCYGVVRGVSDNRIDKALAADREWQPKASRTAAAFAFALLDSVSPTETMPRQQTPAVTNIGLEIKGPARSEELVYARDCRRAYELEGKSVLGQPARIRGIITRRTKTKHKTFLDVADRTGDTIQLVIESSSPCWGVATTVGPRDTVLAHGALTVMHPKHDQSPVLSIAATDLSKVRSAEDEEKADDPEVAGSVAPHRAIYVARLANHFRQRLVAQAFSEVATKLISTDWPDDGVEVLRVTFEGFGAPIFLSPSPVPQLIDSIIESPFNRIFSVGRCITPTYRDPHVSTEADVIAVVALDMHIRRVLEEVHKMAVELYRSGPTAPLRSVRTTVEVKSLEWPPSGLATAVSDPELQIFAPLDRNNSLSGPGTELARLCWPRDDPQPQLRDCVLAEGYSQLAGEQATLTAAVINIERLLTLLIEERNIRRIPKLAGESEGTDGG